MGGYDPVPHAGGNDVGSSGGSKGLTWQGSTYTNVYWGSTSPNYVYLGSTLSKTSDGGPILDNGQRGWRYLAAHRKRLWQKMRAGGVIGPRVGVNSSKVDEVWKMAMIASAISYANDPKHAKKPWDFLKADADGGSLASMAGPAPFTGTKHTSQTDTSTSLNLSTPGDAHQLIDQALSNQLGREATKHEKANFLKMLNAQERKHPTKTTTHTSTATKVVEGEAVSSNSSHTTKTTGGYSENDRNEFALAEARKKPGWKAYQQGVPFYDAFLSAIGSIGGS